MLYRVCRVFISSSLSLSRGPAPAHLSRCVCVCVLLSRFVLSDQRSEDVFLCFIRTDAKCCIGYRGFTAPIPLTPGFTFKTRGGSAQPRLSLSRRAPIVVELASMLKFYTPLTAWKTSSTSLSGVLSSATSSSCVHSKTSSARRRDATPAAGEALLTRTRIV